MVPWVIRSPKVPGWPGKGSYCLCSQGQYKPRLWALLAQAGLVLLSGGSKGDGQLLVPSVQVKIEPILQCLADPCHLFPYMQGMEADSGFADNKGAERFAGAKAKCWALFSVLIFM